MTTTDTDTIAGTAAFALLSDGDAAALEASHNSRLAAITAQTIAMIDAALADHFAERDRVEAAAHDALLAHLAARTETLAEMELAAAAVAAMLDADKTALPRETAMTDAQHADPAAATATPVAMVGEQVSAEPTSQLPRGVALQTSVDLPAGFAAIVAERRRIAETAWLARTADRRAKHAAALTALALVESRIAEIAAVGGGDAGPRPRAIRRRDRITRARLPASPKATGSALST